MLASHIEPGPHSIPSSDNLSNFYSTYVLWNLSSAPTSEFDAIRTCI